LFWGFLGLGSHLLFLFLFVCHMRSLPPVCIFIAAYPILTGVHLRQARPYAILVYRGAYACHSAPSRDRKTAYEAGPAHRANQEFLCARSHPAAPRGSRRSEE